MTLPFRTTAGDDPCGTVVDKDSATCNAGFYGAVGSTACGACVSQTGCATDIAATCSSEGSILAKLFVATSASGTNMLKFIIFYVFAVGDFDNDGVDDFVSASTSGISWYKNTDGQGNFNSLPIIVTTAAATRITVGDVNGISFFFSFFFLSLIGIWLACWYFRCDTNRCSS